MTEKGFTPQELHVVKSFQKTMAATIEALEAHLKRVWERDATIATLEQWKAVTRWWEWRRRRRIGRALKELRKARGY